MGTRADFYIGRGKNAKWIGSIAWDGYPSGITPKGEKVEQLVPGCLRHIDENWPEGEHLFDSKTEEEFISRLDRFFMYRDDVSLPNDGWPWPWDDSNTTDYTYSFDDGKVYGACFGHGWWLADSEPEEHEDGKIDDWPNMKEVQKISYGSKSGLIVIRA